MAVVRTTFEMKKPRIAVLNEGPCGLVGEAGVMVVHLLEGDPIIGRARRMVCVRKRGLGGRVAS
jgi:hypothetical protein